VDLTDALATLREHGLARILSEGGPHVLAELFAADLVDELCLAIAPVVAAGDGLRITAGPALATPKQLRLAQVLERDQFLFLRYTR
jgi:riboflavin biosynthesis pyrimidine reductase